MKIEKINVYAAKLELSKPFSHGSFTRVDNEPIFVEIIGENGLSGFGESLARGYVTGESPHTVVQNLERYVDKMPREFDSVLEISDFLHGCEPATSKNMASLCGMDMALLDLYGKTNQKSVSKILRSEFGYGHTHTPRVTSGPMSLDTKEWKKTFYCFAGIKDIKLKISPDADPERTHRIARGFPRPRTFRLDGNCSMQPEQLREFLEKAKVVPDYIEQPFPVGVHSVIPSVKFLADESLVSLDDAKTTHFDAYSVRIGKNGGFLRTLEIIEDLEHRNKPYMFGSLVGETSLLSGAFLHLASITNAFLHEGCYSTRLLKNDPTDIHPNVGYRGRVRFDYEKPGIGVDLQLDGLDKKLVLER